MGTPNVDPAATYDVCGLGEDTERADEPADEGIGSFFIVER